MTRSLNSTLTIDGPEENVDCGAVSAGRAAKLLKPDNDWVKGKGPYLILRGVRGPLTTLTKFQITVRRPNHDYDALNCSSPKYRRLWLRVLNGIGALDNGTLCRSLFSQHCRQSFVSDKLLNSRISVAIWERFELR